MQLLHILVSGSVGSQSCKLRIQVHVLTPVPMTGPWAAGKTFRTALRLVESVINQDQFLGERTVIRIRPREALKESWNNMKEWAVNIQFDPELMRSWFSVLNRYVSGKTVGTCVLFLFSVWCFSILLNHCTKVVVLCNKTWWWWRVCGNFT